MGAWIEIGRVVGRNRNTGVAPHVGAWIEIHSVAPAIRKNGVAPHVGAWIEIKKTGKLITVILSHPTWVRGLKYFYIEEEND